MRSFDSKYIQKKGLKNIIKITMSMLNIEIGENYFPQENFVT